jgi:carbonic anhydrase
MQKLLSGIHQFQRTEFRRKAHLFKRLAEGQEPTALFFTCSDSRVNPNLVTQSEPGDIFVVRNAGNIIPPAPEMGGEIATIEFAVKSLKIKDIIICGHSDCGAMKGVLNPSALGNDLKALKVWLSHAKRTGEIMKTRYTHLQGKELLSATVGENVLVQVENLKTHSFIQKALDAGDLAIHGWVYKFETGEVFYYDTEDGQYHPLTLQNGLCPIYPVRTHHGENKSTGGHLALESMMRAIS